MCALLPFTKQNTHPREQPLPMALTLAAVQRELSDPKHTHSLNNNSPNYAAGLCAPRNMPAGTRLYCGAGAAGGLCLLMLTQLRLLQTPAQSGLCCLERLCPEPCPRPRSQQQSRQLAIRWSLTACRKTRRNKMQAGRQADRQQRAAAATTMRITKGNDAHSRAHSIV